MDQLTYDGEEMTVQFKIQNSYTYSLLAVCINFIKPKEKSQKIQNTSTANEWITTNNLIHIVLHLIKHFLVQ